MDTLKEAMQVIAVGACLFMLIYFGCVFLQTHIKQPVIQNLPPPLLQAIAPSVSVQSDSPSVQKAGLVPPPPPLPPGP